MASGERILRKMVAQLAEMPVQARAAVLNQLGDGQRERVQFLLDEYRSPDLQPRPPAPPIDPRGLPSGLSPWLVELLGKDDGAADRGDSGRLTLDTLDALKACAAELTPASDSPAKSKGIWQAIAGRLPVHRARRAAR